MKILVVGSAGMIGKKLLNRLAADGALNGQQISHVVGFDALETSPPPADFSFTGVVGDISDLQSASSLIAERPDVVFHLAAVVSGEAETDFQKGYRINLDGTRFLLDAIVREPDYSPRVVFASSIAVFGGPFPESISDEFQNTPLTSYGTQKAIGELLLSDYSRRQLLDGVGIRLPTICVRPGKPNKAASGFFSNIIREPLAGHDAVLPVSGDVRHWHASPRAAVNFLLHAAAIDGDRVGNRRNLTMPGISVTVDEQIAALRKLAGEAVVARIRREPDESIMRMVSGWPKRFDPTRALSLGFTAESSFEDIIRVHLADELHGVFA